MEPFLLLLLVCFGIGILFGLPAIGFLMGMYAKPEGSRTPMCAKIIDCMDLKHDGDMHVIQIKYHPKTGHYVTPLKDTPDAKGLGTIIVKEGLFGWRSRTRTIETARLQLPKNLKGGYGTYGADLLDVRMKERLDRLLHENSDLTLKLAEAEKNYEQLARNQEQAKQEDRDQFVKNLVKVNPPLHAQRRTSGGGR